MGNINTIPLDCSNSSLNSMLLSSHIIDFSPGDGDTGGLAVCLHAHTSPSSCHFHACTHMYTLYKQQQGQYLNL